MSKARELNTGKGEYSSKKTRSVKENRYGRWELMLCCMAIVMWLVNRQAAAEGDRSQAITYATPAGITLIEVIREGYLESAGYQWTRLGDSQGRTLFVSDQDVTPGQSSCKGECAQMFPPVTVLPGASEMGEWTVIARDDGSMQWAYQGRPLYRFAREERLHHVVDTVLAQEAPKNTFEETRTDPNGLLPPEGWHVARFTPAANQKRPPSVEPGNVPMAGGIVFTDAIGMTLYWFNGADDQSAQLCGEGYENPWLPLRAAALSRPVGDFTLAPCNDGGSQWAYRGVPLFKFAGDSVPGDVNGIDQDSDLHWQTAVYMRYFMPRDATVRRDMVHGKVLSMKSGMPLYTRNPYGNFREKAIYGKYSLYVRGKRLGVKGCDQQCLQSWRPFIAPADARPRGFWEILEREDGSRQWAYKGFALYTYVNDKPNGPPTGHNIYDYAIGDKGRYKAAEAVAINPGKRSPGAYFWAVATP